MANYFEEFEKTKYRLGGKNHNLTNIFDGFVVKSEIFDRISVFFEYHISEGDTPEIVADKLYGNMSLEWVILHFNKIHDPFFEWPLDYYSLEQHIKTKYGSLENSHQTVKEYRWIVFHKTVDDFGNIHPERSIIVDANTYQGIDAKDRKKISCYEYEVQENERKKVIRVPDSAYIKQLISEKKDVMKK